MLVTGTGLTPGGAGRQRLLPAAPAGLSGSAEKRALILSSVKRLRSHSESARIVCSPNRIRLTAAAVFAGQQWGMENVDKFLQGQENRRNQEGRSGVG